MSRVRFPSSPPLERPGLVTWPFALFPLSLLLIGDRRLLPQGRARICLDHFLTNSSISRRTPFGEFSCLGRGVGPLVAVRRHRRRERGTFVQMWTRGGGGIGGWRRQVTKGC